MVLNPWTPLASSRPTPNLATYVISAATLLYLAVSLRKCNTLAKAFCQAVNFYPIVYALNGFEPPNLPFYLTKVLPSILGYYRWLTPNQLMMERRCKRQGSSFEDNVAGPIVQILKAKMRESNKPLLSLCKNRVIVFFPFNMCDSATLQPRHRGIAVLSLQLTAVFRK
ncbi:hypothetical protein DSO57_1006114 [Entomophthora muscae]|uniref:Uncharacterized protein n=1 Tax=Entomophthora muscae TaxID=34485 RepID=A0ACC2TIG6_9FUNG|nr:hypothetical protein DSO57_1006114 [Entomophthora muscae]